MSGVPYVLFFGLWVVLFLVLPDTRAASAPAARSAVVLEEFVYETAAFPSSHAATILELPGGELLTAFFGGSAEGDPDVEIYDASNVHTR